MTNWLVRLALAATVLLTAAAPSFGQGKQSGSKGEDLEKGLPADVHRLKIGDAAPDFSLKGVDGIDYVIAQGAVDPRRTVGPSTLAMNDQDPFGERRVVEITIASSPLGANGIPAARWSRAISRAIRYRTSTARASAPFSPSPLSARPSSRRSPPIRTA